MNRFARHRLIAGFDQDRLLRSRVLVVGAGAIGNEVLKNLALLGTGAIHILDPDLIEESNLTRSILFRESDLGQPKARIAAEACARLFPEGNFTWSQAPFWDWASLARLRDFDAAVAATDNLESRLELNRLCRLAPIDLFNAGIDARHVAVEAFPFRSAPGCGCYECTLPAAAHAQRRARLSCAGLRRTAIQEGRVPTTAITSSHAGAGLAAALLNTLFQHPARPRGAYRQLLDTANPLASSAVTIAPAAACLECAEGLPTERRSSDPWLRELPPDWCAELTSDLLLSNPIVLGTECPACGEHRNLILAAEEADDRLQWCARCARPSARVALRDQLSPGELRQLPGAAALPVKYLSFSRPHHTVLIEINPP